jgi:hypothetical protein
MSVWTVLVVLVAWTALGAVVGSIVGHAAGPDGESVVEYSVVLRPAEQPVWARGDDRRASPIA